MLPSSLSSSLQPAIARPRLYAGAEQPARLSLEIDVIAGDGEPVPVAVDDVLHLPFCALTRLSRSDRKALPKVLLVAPLSCHFPILLRDVVLGLLENCEVFITDWVNARDVPLQCGRFGLAENIAYILEAMRVLGPGLHVLALCQGAVPALVATAHQAESGADCTPVSLVLMAGPVDPAVNPTRVSRMLGARALSWYERNVIMEVPPGRPGKGRLVYPASVQLVGLWSYLARHISAGGELLSKLLRDDGADPLRFPFLDLYSALMDLPAEVFLDIVRHVYCERTLACGQLQVGNANPSLRAIRTTALMTVEGEYDDIAAPNQTARAHALCPSVPDAARGKLVVPACGHFSLFHGGVWRKRVLPHVRAFMARSAETTSRRQ
jgi:poly(3-hydroxybutyrate) depolymerase